MVLATQTVEDFASADLLRTVVESCPDQAAAGEPRSIAGTMRSCFR